MFNFAFKNFSPGLNLVCARKTRYTTIYIYIVLYNDITVLADNNCCLAFDTIAKKIHFFSFSLISDLNFYRHKNFLYKCQFSKNLIVYLQLLSNFLQYKMSDTFENDTTKSVTIKTLQIFMENTSKIY